MMILSALAATSLGAQTGRDGVMLVAPEAKGYRLVPVDLRSSFASDMASPVTRCSLLEWVSSMVFWFSRRA